MAGKERARVSETFIIPLSSINVGLAVVFNFADAFLSDKILYYFFFFSFIL